MNRTDQDSKPYYFGMSIGFSLARFQTELHPVFLQHDSVYVAEPTNSGGISLGFQATARLSNRFQLRFNPQLMFVERNIFYKLKYPDINGDTAVTKKVESILAAFPVNLKFQSDRIAVDLSEDALAVARRNVDDYGLNDQIELVHSDLFDAIGDRRFDLIISNPPYVTADAMAALPPEYLHEPHMALAAGEDGLDIVRRLIAEAATHLHPEGILAVEIGHNRDLVENAFPDLPFSWLSTEGGEDMVFLLKREDLPGGKA